MALNLSLTQFLCSKAVKFPLSPVEFPCFLRLWPREGQFWLSEHTEPCPGDSRSCQASQTAALNRNISWTSLGWNVLERQKESKARNKFPGGNLSNESLKSHQEKHTVKDSLELLGGEVILQHILHNSPEVFRVLVSYRNWWDDLSSRKSPEKKQQFIPTGYHHNSYGCKRKTETKLQSISGTMCWQGLIWKENWICWKLLQ